MASPTADLLSSVRKAMADLANLYATLDEGVIDVVKEARLGLQSTPSRSAIGLAASRVSSLLYFSLPTDVGPEIFTLSVDPDQNLAIQLDDEIEWLAVQAFVNADLSTPRRFYVETRYADPTRGAGRFLRLEYFFRVYTPGDIRFHDTPVEREQVPFGTDVARLQKAGLGSEIAEYKGRNCLIFFFPHPPRQILISKLRIYPI